MKKILFICPYYGHFPNYFSLVLKSIEYNPSINWLIFTDDKTKYNFPNNVQVEYLDFSELNQRIQRKLGCSKLFAPYKLCDIRPFYGIVFEDYIATYDFWGHCDFDCFFGDIRKWLKDDILSDYNKVLFLGHMSLYKNSIKMQSLVTEYLALPETRKALSVPYPCQLDEVGIIDFFQKNDEMIYNEQGMIADINCLAFPFEVNNSILCQKNNRACLKSIADKEKKGLVFAFKKGKLQGIWLDDNNQIAHKDYMYVHFQKREFSINVKQGMDSFLVVPNKIICHEEIDKNFLCEFMRCPFVYRKFFKIKYNNLKNKIRRLIL